MWAKNGSHYLPQVLKRIEEVIPTECIGQRIFVDDKSTDGSPEIAQSFNWTIYPNPTGFVSGGASEALRHVELPFFVSVEQDILLAKNWWDTVPPHMENPEVAVAQGIRVSPSRQMQILNLDYRPEIWSLDNNIFRTDVIRKLGGFPMGEPMSVDYSLLMKIAARTHYLWVIDQSAVSTHIKTSITDVVRHEQDLLLRGLKPVGTESKSFLGMLQLTATSPLRGLQLSYSYKDPTFLILYPYLRLVYLRGFLRRRRVQNRRTATQEVPPNLLVISQSK